MVVDHVLSLFTTLTSIEIMLALGFGAAASAALKSGNRVLIVPAFFANRLIVPGAALGLLLPIRVGPIVAFAEFQGSAIDVHGLSPRLPDEGVAGSLKLWNEPMAEIESAVLHNGGALQKAG